ncbi:MAG: hypothetical protein A2Y82_03680 [Candidatus Buchananbacteria bacterium RBG_13_36_9]|uniref:Uncharacterized protein n=1 Tax=Candidatus Buchananbacteria bacterium RBG_13_36_9 TaxID=1797530 RepID=A0A1G1XLC1_9BACT|nr:MAG: hypothetical protein A2Y82_03680 [Candidatus Buchananbacteria bacterium RBG_13_36_9]
MGAKSRNRKSRKENKLQDKATTINRKLPKFLLFLAVTVVVIGVIFAFTKKQSSSNWGELNHQLPQATTTNDFQQRLEIIDYILQSMKGVVDKTQDEEARKLYNFLNLNYVLARVGKFDPGHNAWTIDLSSKDGRKINQLPKDKVGIYVVMGEDQTNENREFFQKERLLDRTFFHQNVGTFFISYGWVINYSSPMMGIIMLHETKHAQQRITSGRINQNEQDMLRHEVEAYLFETGLIGKLLGPEYYKIRDKMSSEIEINFSQIVPPEISFNPYFNISHKEELKKILWPIKGQNELDLVYWLTGIDAMLTLANKSVQPNDIANLQLSIIKYFSNKH